MRLRKCLEITKTTTFHVFIYPKGHIKENRGIDEIYIDLFDINRNEKGILPYNLFKEYDNCKVVEIIPNTKSVNIVAEIN